MAIKMRKLFVPQLLETSEREVELQDKVNKLEEKLQVQTQEPVTIQSVSVETKGKTNKKR